MPYPRKVQEIEHAKRVKAQYPHMALTTIAKIVGVANSTLYKSSWYQTTVKKNWTVQKSSSKSVKPEGNKLSQEVGEIVDLLHLVTTVQARLLTKLEGVYEQV